LAIASLAACSSEPVDVLPPPPPPPPATNPAVAVFFEAATGDTLAFVGEAYALRVSLFDSAGQPTSRRRLTWTTDAPQIATVDSAGVILPHALGVVTVSFTTDGHSASRRLQVRYGGHVDIEGKSIISPGRATLIVGGGAIRNSTAVGVALLDPVIPQAPGNPSHLTVLPGTGIDVSPHRYNNYASSTLILSYDPATLPAGVDPSRVTMFELDKGALVPIGPVYGERDQPHGHVLLAR
jgi:hypothetical protein